MSPEEIRDAVFDRYGSVADEPGESHGFPVGRDFALSVGYDEADLDALPPGCSESFTGAGNPQAAVDLGPDERLLDLGCGAGLDLCLYGRRFGSPGRIAGLDGSRSMAEKARCNLDEAGMPDTEVFCTRAETIPLPDAHLDVVTANGIFNLSPTEDKVMAEIARVLKPGGRLVFAEIILANILEDVVRESIGDWFKCIGGAMLREDLINRLRDHGFSEIEILSADRNARTGHPSSLCAVVRATRSD
jgi:SAM-dependent methyltransferase